MKRKSFLALSAALPLIGTVPAASDEIALPAELRGGRFFALPRVPGGATFACWLDTDGSGFVFANAVRRLALPVRRDGTRSLTRLPRFDPARAVPPVVRNDGELPVFDPQDADAADPILQGFDAQLGGSWFADRAWRLDFARGTIALRLTPLASSDANAPLSLDRDFPRTAAAVEGETLAMPVDIAASVATAQGVVATSFVRRDLFERWRSEHPQWRVDTGFGSLPGTDRIVVPELRVGGTIFTDVAFTTRPNDDVFEGSDLAAKLGANAYAGRVLTIDYPNARLRIE
jgi:hypothetical protein